MKGDDLWSLIFLVVAVVGVLAEQVSLQLLY